MTKTEMKMILALIDAYCVDKRTPGEKAGNITYSGYLEMPCENIFALKEKIEEVFGDK